MISQHNSMNLNSLLVIGQNDNTLSSSGAVTGGKLVASSHKRCKLGHTIKRHNSTGNQRIREVTPATLPPCTISQTVQNLEQKNNMSIKTDSVYYRTLSFSIMHGTILTQSHTLWLQILMLGTRKIVNNKKITYQNFLLHLSVSILIFVIFVYSISILFQLFVTQF